MLKRDPIPGLKQQLGAELARLLVGWRAADVAFRLGTEASRVSDLRRGDLRRFSLESLVRFVTRMGPHVVIQVVRSGPTPRR